MDLSGLFAFLISVALLGGFTVAGVVIFYLVIRKRARDVKDYERALKMVQIRIQLPPSSDERDLQNRDAREVTDEMVSKAQTMYNVIASTATRNFHSRIYGQRHIGFEIVAKEGLVQYYASVPYVLLDNIRQAILAAYPNARLDEVTEVNIFSRAGSMSGTLGGELVLNKQYALPIATYKDSKHDVMGAILNAMTQATTGEGVGVQILLRPASENWSRSIETEVKNIKDGKTSGGGGDKAFSYFSQIMEALWVPPESKEGKVKEPVTISGVDQARIEAMEEKARHAGYEVMIRLVVSTSNSSRSQALLTGLQSAFSLFNSPTGNSFKFVLPTSIEDFVTSYILKIFPASRNSDILNTVELASIFHLPNQTNIVSSKVEQQRIREIEAPPEPMDPNGILLGYNTFRGVKKEIRLSIDDRRRHTYVMGSTGMGKSVFLENLAIQDMRAGRGFAFLDPHGDAAEALLKVVPENRINDVIYFNPPDMDNPIGMNIFEIDPNDPDRERKMDHVIAEVNNMLTSLYDPNHQGIVGPMMTNIVRNASLLIMSSPQGGTFMDIPKVLIDDNYRNSRIPYLKNQRALDYWTKEWPNMQRSNEAGEIVSWVVSKWADFESTMITNILGQVKSRLNIREIMDNEKILLVNLSKGRMGELPARLLGMFFVMRFQIAAMSRNDTPEHLRKDFCLYVDEFQNFATDSFESILSEARKYRLNLIVANQFMSQLMDKIRNAIQGNAGTFIIGRCGTNDVEDVVKLFQPVFRADDMLGMPNHMAAIKTLINGYPTKPFTMNLPAPMGHPNDELGKALTAMSAKRYGTPRAIVEAEIKKRWGGESKATTGANVPEHKPAKSVVTGEAGGSSSGKSSSSIVDSWLAKRKSINNQGNQGGQSSQNAVTSQPSTLQPQPQSAAVNTPVAVPQSQPQLTPQPQPVSQLTSQPQLPPQPISPQPQPAMAPPIPQLSQVQQSQFNQPITQQPAHPVVPTPTSMSAPAPSPEVAPMVDGYPQQPIAYQQPPVPQPTPRPQLAPQSAPQLPPQPQSAPQPQPNPAMRFRNPDATDQTNSQNSNDGGYTVSFR